MQQILTYDNLIEKIKEIDSKNEQVIAFVLAPYNLKDVSQIIDQIYDAYDFHCEDSRIHLYWIGYMKSYDINRFRWKVNRHYDNNLCFDLRIFDDITKKLNQKWCFEYKNRFEIVFVKLHKNKIYFNKHIRIDFDKEFSNSYEMIDFIISINQAMNTFKTFESFKLEIKSRRNLKRLKKIKFTDLVELLPIFELIKYERNKG